MPTPSNKLSDIIYEYGKAANGNWSNTDGKDVFYAMETISSYVKDGKTILTNDEAESLRICLGLCPNGCGNWWDECEAYGCDLEE